ncbi:hypothetical protein PTSG_02938 [Salpingoeca rosetta]|uniref:Uncharacterized protein n=1 Tax=Salpingoeca rosetta (strain ATCC 50818 / BSB-021) TaxID=946362 RepID=F2U3S4_SALR5|nr:uncharacterized protein PTSG_02938 [Salpingoeca rosetta]EGD82268.1 hypothetical protein PTSG_02938 [Salpingoeca rosetta]|eukprot:XP_004996451.1 hypothetical protein PTSG_02938 [Salpingoeca rosetta]
MSGSNTTAAIAGLHNRNACQAQAAREAVNEMRVESEEEKRLLRLVTEAVTDTPRNEKVLTGVAGLVIILPAVFTLVVHTRVAWQRNHARVHNATGSVTVVSADVTRGQGPQAWAWLKRTLIRADVGDRLIHDDVDLLGIGLERLAVNNDDDDNDDDDDDGDGDDNEAPQ